MLQDLADKTAADSKVSIGELKALVSLTSGQLATLKSDHRAVVLRVGGAESRIQTLTEFAQENREVNKHIEDDHKKMMTTTLSRLQEQLGHLDILTKKADTSLEALKSDTKTFQSSA